MRLIFLFIVVSAMAASASGNPFQNQLDRMMGLMNSAATNLKKIGQAVIGTFFDDKHRLANWRKKYPEKSKDLNSFDSEAVAWRFEAGMHLTECSPRHILSGMLGMTQSAIDLAEYFVKVLFKRSEQLTTKAVAAITKTMREMHDRSKCYANIFRNGQIRIKNHILYTSFSSATDALAIRLLNLVEGHGSASNLERDLKQFDPQMEKVRTYITEVVMDLKNNLLQDIAYRNALSYTMFLYYRAVFYNALKTALANRDGNTDKKDAVKEEEFVDKIKKDTNVDKTPPKKNPGEDEKTADKSSGTTDKFLVTIDGKPQLINAANGGKYVKDTIGELEQSLKDLITYVVGQTVTSNELNRRLTESFTKIKTATDIYFHFRNNQKDMIDVYNEMKTSIIAVFDLLFNTYNQQIDEIEVVDSIVEDIGPPIESIETLYKHTRRAYLGNSEDKTSFITLFNDDHADTELAISQLIGKYVGAARSEREILKLLVPMRVIAYMQAKTYCRLTKKCKYRK